MSLQFIADMEKVAAVKFGNFLMTQSLIHMGYREYLDKEKVWDTKEGEWLTMEELYDKFLNQDKT